MSDDRLLSTILGGSIILLVVLALIALAFSIVYVVALWKLFKKAGKNGWEALIPFYNTYVLIEIAGLNWWYFLIAISGTIFGIFNINGLSTVTNLAALAVNFFVFYNIAKKMNQSPVGFGVASVFVAPIVVMILGFSSKYTYDSSISVNPNGPIGDNKDNTNPSEPEKYCLGCGCKLKPGIQFCDNCGKKVE